MPFWGWSKTAASNANSDATINWAEGMAPSAVNDSARAMEARLREFADDISSKIATGGTSTAYTVTTNQVFDTLAHMNGEIIAFVPHTTNGATVTLNVDGLGAKALRYGPNLELQTGMLIQGTPYVVAYSNADSAFYLRGFSANPYGVPLGGMMPYVGSSAPNSAFVLPFGQAISRATYATLFALTGTTFGVGDGSTTFNIPDLRGRSIFGLDNMGGSAASRITTAGSSIDGTSLGAAGGAQTVTLARANLPNVQLTATGNITPKVAGLAMIGPNTGAVPTNFVTGAGASVYSAATFATVDIVTLDGGATSSINGNVTQTVVNEMPPAMILPYILRVL